MPTITPANFFAYYSALFDSMAFLLGAIVGSFLNVCVYRLPLGLSVNEPKRSFCPQCKAQLAWCENLPIVGWLLLRGRCAHCRQPISARYPLLELLTAGLFLLAWMRFRQEWILVGPYWLLISLLIVATFIDFDHFIIPDEITIGGTVAGVLLSLAVPQMMAEASHVLGLMWSLLGAAVGHALLWLVAEGGKLAFGKKRFVLPQPQDFTWAKRADGQDADLVVGGETDQWSEFFSRDSDELILRCDRLAVAGVERADAELRCFFDRVTLDGETYPLEELDTFSGRLRECVFPREAMGLGDVKLMACVGAFLGWQAVPFTFGTAAVIGTVTLAHARLTGKGGHQRLPFGPSLACAALIWLFAGPSLVHWYVSRFLS